MRENLDADSERTWRAHGRSGQRRKSEIAVAKSQPVGTIQAALDPEYSEVPNFASVAKGITIPFAQLSENNT
jgi:hypothetical protein